MPQNRGNQNQIDTVSNQSEKKQPIQNLDNLKDGILGMRNNSYYCYLNAFMQCLAPITEMRDHYLLQKYANY